MGAGMIVVAIVQPRVEQDQKRQALPAGPSPRVGETTFERINDGAITAPNVQVAHSEEEAQRIVAEARAAGVPVQYMTAEEYEEFARATPAAREGWPTVGGTDETLLDRTIAATAGVDQGTLAQHARENGRLDPS